MLAHFTMLPSRVPFLIHNSAFLRHFLSLAISLRCLASSISCCLTFVSSFLTLFFSEVTEASKQKFAAILTAIETNHVPLAALWVFDFDSQANNWNVNATNVRRWQLDAIEQANFGRYSEWTLARSQGPIAIRKVYEELEGRLK